MADEYPKITFKKVEIADELGTVIEKSNYNFDQIAMFSDLVKPRKIEKGDRGIPGATGVGKPGDKGERGSIIHYSSLSISDGDPVTDPTHLVNDTIIDNVPKFLSVIEDGLGNKFYELEMNLATILSTEYLINQYDYLTGSGTAIISYIQRNNPTSPSPGDPGSENLSLVKRINDNQSEFYRLMVGTDRYLNDPIDISLYVANILPEAGKDANDTSLPQYSQIGLKYRPDSASNLTVNTAFIKYHEYGNKWTFSVINAGVGVYAEYDISDQNNNTVYLRGRKIKLVGNTANIDPSNINKYIEFDVNTSGNAIFSSNTALSINSTVTIGIDSPITTFTGANLLLNSASLQANADNVAFFIDNDFTIFATSMNIYGDAIFQNSVSLASSAIFKIGISTGVARNFIKRQSPNSSVVVVGNTSDNVAFYTSNAFTMYGVLQVRDIIMGTTGNGYAENPSFNTVIFGDATTAVYIRTGISDLMHRRNNVDYRIWDEFNDGAASGLDADLLDGQHGSYYRDADLLDGQHGSYYLNASNLNAGTVPLDRLPGRLVTKIFTVGFKWHGGFLGAAASDYMLECRAKLSDSIEYLNTIVLPARSKVVHTLIECVESMAAAPVMAGIEIAIGNTIDTAKYLTNTSSSTVDSLGEFSEKDQAAVDMVSRTVRVRFLLHSHGHGYDTISAGRFRVAMSYIQY